jgi:colanic acid biosynthesis glycosyl transferase WcaI
MVKHKHAESQDTKNNMKKRITLIGINFFPEDTAIGLYSTQMAQMLAADGFEVNVLTGFPYYPEWAPRVEYADKPRFYKEKLNDITIFRYRQYIPKNPSALKRLLHVIDFTFGTFFNLFRIKKSDLTICIVPFTSTVFLGSLLKILLKTKIWVHVQDFEFDAAFQSGILKGSRNLQKFAYKILLKIEQVLFDRAHLITTISSTMQQKLLTKTKTKNGFLPNWVDVDGVIKGESIQHPFVPVNKYVILYSGNIGFKQDWDTFIRVAELAGNADPEIQFVVVGDGSKKEWLEREIKKSKNIKLYPPVPYKELPSLLCSPSLHILLQLPSAVDAFMPSKLLGMMASGKPSLLSANPESEVSHVINGCKGGICLSENNPEEIFKSILYLKKNKKVSSEIGHSARTYVQQNFSIDSILPKIKGFIDSIT